MKLIQNVIIAVTLLCSSSLIFANPAARFAVGYTKTMFSIGFGATSLGYAFTTKEKAFQYSQQVGEYDIVNNMESTILRAPFRCLTLPVRVGRFTAEAIFITDAERDRLKRIPRPRKPKSDSDEENPPIFASLL